MKENSLLFCTWIRRGRRRKQPLDDFKERKTRTYWNLEEEELHHTLWRTRFKRSYWSLAKQTAEWMMNEWRFPSFKLIIFIRQYVLRQIYTLFQSEFSTECHLVLPLSIFSHLPVSLRPTRSSLRLFPRLPVASTIPSIIRFRRQFLRKMWPIQLAILLFIVRNIFLSSLTVCNTSSFLTRSLQLIFSILLQYHIFKTFHVFLIYFPKCPCFSTI
jgi:hypothetical protein